MPGLPYDKLSEMPSVAESAPLEDEMLGTMPGEEEDAEGLSPELRQLGTELGFSPKQAAALKEFFHACALEGDAELEEPEAEY